MYSVNSWARLLCLVCLLAIGCNSKPAASTSSSSEDGDVAVTGAKRAKSGLPVKLDVKDVIGNWVIVMTNQRSDTYRWLINFSRGADDKIVATFVDTRHDKDEKPEIVETEVNGDAVQFTIKNSQMKFDFVGTLQQGFIRGTIGASPSDSLLARLLPTDEQTLEKFTPTGMPPGADVFDAKMKSKDFNPDDFLSTIREYRTSPLAQDMYGMLMSAHAQAKFDEAKVQEIIGDFESSAKIWGPRWEAHIELVIAVSLINGRQFPQLALAHLDAAEKLGGFDQTTQKEMLTGLREAANTAIRVQEINSPTSTDEVRANAALEMAELLKKHPYDAEILSSLAAQAERTGQVDQAIDYLSDIVALPMLEINVLQMRAGQPPDTPKPSELLKKLWIQKHGNEEGYEPHLTEVYHQKIAALLAEMQQTAPEVPTTDLGNKTVLLEFFTGMQCPPCVAANLALDAISKSYPQNKVIVLSYHQHIPGPDGLTNRDSEERAAFYEITGAPTVALDGQLILNRFYAGAIPVATTGYGVLRKVIDARLPEKTDIAIQLSAVVTDRQLSINAEVTGIPEEVLPSCRLRMAIVENQVHTYLPLASNGIRDHEFVVREMPGGAKGILPKKGELKYSMTMPVSDLQQHLTDYIHSYEAGRRLEFLPDMKPPIRGPLSLVAWVQNGTPDNKSQQGKLVLQSAIIPITGDTGFEAAAASASAVPATSPPATAAAAPAIAPPTTETVESTPPAPALPE